jgi:ribonuclease HI
MRIIKMHHLIKTEPPEETETTLIAFTDGACSNNGKSNAKASYAVVWPYHMEYNDACLLPNHPTPTNNRAEYMALIHALNLCERHLDPTFSKTLIVYTDSMLLFNSITDWICKWKRNGWMSSTKDPVANRDLLEIIDHTMSKRKVVLRHVRAHQKNEHWESIHNNLVDQLARDKLKN